jgi:hypothetical protein
MASAVVILVLSAWRHPIVQHAFAALPGKKQDRLCLAVFLAAPEFENGTPWDWSREITGKSEVAMGHPGRFGQKTNHFG